MRTRTDSSLSTLVGQDGTVLVTVSANWCSPCRMLKPVVDLVAHERAVTLRVARVDADRDPELADALGIAVLPTLILYRDGVEIRRATGFRGAADLADFIDR